MTTCDDWDESTDQQKRVLKVLQKLCPLPLVIRGGFVYGRLPRKDKDGAPHGVLCAVGSKTWKQAAKEVK